MRAVDRFLELLKELERKREDAGGLLSDTEENSYTDQFSTLWPSISEIERLELALLYSEFKSAALRGEFYR